MKTKQQFVRYGVHYTALEELLHNGNDRIVFQKLFDIVRMQLMHSLENQTAIISVAQLSRMTKLERSNTLPACLKRLETLGLIRRHKNGITIDCDGLATLLYHYELLPLEERQQFSDAFQRTGVNVLHAEKYADSVKFIGRAELIGLSGSSISLNRSDVMNIPQSEENELLNIKQPTGNNLLKSQQEPEEDCLDFSTFLQSIAKFAEFSAPYCSADEFSAALGGIFDSEVMKNHLSVAFSNKTFQKTFTNEIQNLLKSQQITCLNLSRFASKAAEFSATVIIYRINKKNEGEIPETESDKNEGREDIFKGFDKVEVLDLNQPSEEVKEDLEHEGRFSQQYLKRAGRALRERNPYRKKPFIKSDRASEIIAYMDEVVKSPVEFFINQFWEGIYDLYHDHYNPSNKFDEEGEPIEDPDDYNWQEVIGAPLPQDEVYNLARNVYDDLLGAVEQGKYVSGPNNEWETKMGFDSFEDFNPYQIFQWEPSVMQDKTTPALIVALDRFYDIEDKDVYTPSITDRRTRSALNKKFIQTILSSEDIQLTPIEAAIKNFYKDFVVTGNGCIVDEFTDGRGTTLESGGGLPDHLLKPWCIGLPSVDYSEFIKVFTIPYKPCDGVHKKSTIFSAESVVVWNEHNGYRDSIAHTVVKQFLAALDQNSNAPAPI